MSSLRLLTWNLERKRPTAPLGAAALDHLFSFAPDVAVLTEASAEMPVRGGHLLCASALRGEMWRADERKVVLWSRWPWEPIGDAAPCGADRAVAGVTCTPIGPLCVLGVCIPWHLSGTRFTEPAQKAWSQHHDFLDALESVLAGGATFDVIAGDYNQLRPRRWGPLHAEARLLEVLSGFTIETEGQLPGCERPAGIDHIAAGPNVRAIHKFGWPHKVDGVRFSDHEGAGVDLVRTVGR
jgi:hypothetical protein